MSPERWERIEQIYNSALKQTPEQRASFLNEACAGDESLRVEVEALLACQSKVDALCESPALEVAARALARENSIKQLAALTGRVLSHYRVLEKLGEGGMGVVYKALDTRLNRPVALKVLPADMISDAERKRRFVREARAASALNHPNIITIYDIDQAEAIDFIAMEYTSGKSLDEMIPRSGLRISQALKIATQIAEGLSRTHNAGIIHRDLKPSNIMVTSDGLVKILDFGLAKLTEPEGSPAAEAGQTASIFTETEKGMIAGTAAYMSPEQAEGKPVDARSDIFAFGSVLYEMVTGRRAFQGDSPASTMAAVLNVEPKPPSQLASGLPSGLERAIQRCLRKEKERRWQHIDDVKVELEELKAECDSQFESAAHPVARKYIRWLWAALVGIALVCAGILLWRIRTGNEIPLPRVIPLTSYPGQEGMPTFSPEGDRVAFTWNGEKQDNWDIYVKVVGETHSLRLTNDPAPDMGPAWSPDGRQIAFYRTGPAERRGIYLVSALGGQERKVSDLELWNALSWTPDGKWLAVARPRLAKIAEEDLGGIYLIPVGAGAVRRITAPKAPVRDIFPAVSPDGMRIAFARCPTAVFCDVYCQELGADGTPLGESRRITRENSVSSGLSWSRDGGSIIYSASRLWGMRHYLWQVPVNSGKPPMRLEIAGPYALHPAVAPLKNRLAFTHNRSAQDYDVWRLREGEAAAPFITSSMVDMSAEFSPDGRKIAFASDRAGETFDIWMVNADGSEPVQVTHENGNSGTPRWSPDGKYIVFDLHTSEGESDLYRVNVADGRSKRLTWHPMGENLPTFSPDGEWIYFRSNRSGSEQFWRMAVAGGEAQQVTQNGADTGLVSADGGTLYYTSLNVLFSIPVTGGAERLISRSVLNRNFFVTTEGIYYISTRQSDDRYELCILDPLTLQKRVLSRLEGPIFQGLSVSPDRKTILYTRQKDPQSDLKLIENFR